MFIRIELLYFSSRLVSKYFLTCVAHCTISFKNLEVDYSDEKNDSHKFHYTVHQHPKLGKTKILDSLGRLIFNVLNHASSNVLISDIYINILFVIAQVLLNNCIF